jgi:hypothetical protein
MRLFGVAVVRTVDRQNCDVGGGAEISWEIGVIFHVSLQVVAAISPIGLGLVGNNAPSGNCNM